MASPLSAYGFLSAKLKSRIPGLLQEEQFDQAIRARSLQEAFLPLRGTRLETLEARFASTGDLKAVEAELLAMEAAVYTDLFPHLGEPALSFVRALARSVETGVLESALRLWFDARVRGRSVDDRVAYLFRGRVVEDLPVDAIVNARDSADLAGLLDGTHYRDVLRPLLDEVHALGSLFELESALDRHYFAGLFATLPSLGAADRKVAERFAGLEADIQNISCLVRLRSFHGIPEERIGRYLVDPGDPARAASLRRASGAEGLEGMAMSILGDRYGDMPSFREGGTMRPGFAALDRTLRRIRTNEARRLLGGDPFSIGIVLAWRTLATDEVRAVRTILNAKWYGLSEDRTRSAL